MFKSLSYITKGLHVILFFIFFNLGNTGLLFAEESATITTTVSISICGNSIIEGGEVCDIKNLNNLSCEDFGYEYGELRCCISCDEYDISDCSNSPKGIEIEKEVIFEEEVLDDDMKEEEESSKEADLTNSEVNNDKMLLLTIDNDLINDVIYEENDISEIKFPEFEEVLLIQDFTSRSPP